MKGAGFAKDGGAGVECGASREDIINDDVANIWREVCGWISREGLRYITSAFGAIQ